ncbi:MAG: formylglycine-generating enzyme family protein [Desulfobacteraceae bacterium]|nr:formylglycine-generating enzyme family protein [Desulfobacteraceae bacterium]MCB9495060.1 formylglycine-generating enzyme family protein [Desulfobacteraceae bacterium]
MAKYFIALIIFFISCGQSTISAFENSIGIKFRLIPSGMFYMGSPKNERGHQRDEKLHKVYITKPFYMAETETTQQQWLKLMKTNPSSETNRCPNCPVESVSWNDAVSFIEKLNHKEGTTKYRLPTEAEWEYSCRANTDTAFYTGGISSSTCSTEKSLDIAGWYCGNTGKKNPYYNLTHKPVGLKKPNNFGLYDMHGNVMEWCLDSTKWKHLFTTHISASMETYIDGIKDPLGKKGTKKICRGGSFLHSAEMARAANRLYFGPKVKRNYIGFRIVREAP